MFVKPFRRGALTALATLTLSMGVCMTAGAQTGTPSGELTAAQLAPLKAKLAQRVPELPPIDAARATPMAGLIELRAGNHLFYTDASGDFLIDGQLIDTKAKRNLTAARMEEINKVDFASFPFKDALVWRKGNGKRKIVVFADPNCGYCKHLEAEFQQMSDVTVYTFMIPILGGDGKTKIDNIWCSKDRTAAWRDWMLSKVQPAFGLCAGSPGERNLALAQKLNINGTPAVFFEDGTRSPGYEPAAAIEQRLRRAEARMAGAGS